MLAARVAELVGEGGGELHHPLEEAQGALGERPHLDLLLGRASSSSMSSTCAFRNGRYWVTCRMRKRWIPWTTRRSDPSGNRNILWMWVRVPTRKRSLSTGSSTAGSRWVTTPMTLRSRDRVVARGRRSSPGPPRGAGWRGGTAGCPGAAGCRARSGRRSGRRRGRRPTRSPASRSSLNRASFSRGRPARRVTLASSRCRRSKAFASRWARTSLSASAWQSRQRAAKGRARRRAAAISASHSGQRP